MSRFAVVAAALGAMLVLSGCGEEPEPAEPEFPNPLLTRVPADTPYVMATGEPVSESVTEAWNENFRPAIDIMRAQFEQASKELEAEKPALAAQLSAVMDEVLALADKEKREQIGLSREDRLVVYGHGLMPVLRMTVSDPEAFRAFLTRVGNKSGVGFGSTTHEEMEVARLAVDPVVVLGNLHDGVLSVGVATLEGEEAMLEHLASDRPDGESLADSGAASSLVSDYGFQSMGVGYLDIPRMLGLVVGDGIAPGMLDRFGAEMKALTPACRGELVSLAGKVPRLVFGYDEMSESSLAMRSVLELEAGVAGVMADWTVPVPGLGAPTEARYAFGMSLDGTKAAPDIKNWMNAAAKREFACAFLADVPWKESATQINVAPLHMAGNPKGFMIRLDELEIHDIEARDFTASASFVGVFDNAQTLAGMARMMSPELQSLELPTDGTPVQVPAEAMQGFDQPVWLAATNTNLAGALGEGAKQRVTQVMGADAPANPPSLHFDFDAAWFYNTLADWMPRFAEQADDADEGGENGENGEDGSGDSAPSEEELAEIERGAEMMRVYGDILGRMSYQIRFTDRGVEMATRTTLKD
jgi:hypothetical protein